MTTPTPVPDPVTHSMCHWVPDTLRHRIRVRIDDIDCAVYATVGRLPVIRRIRDLQCQVDDLAEAVSQLEALAGATPPPPDQYADHIRRTLHERPRPLRSVDGGRPS